MLPLRDMVTYPGTLTPLAVGQERSMRLIDDVLSGDRGLVMVASKDPELEEPGPDDVERVGVAGVVARMLKVPDGTIRILVQGTKRVRLERFVATEPYLVAAIEEIPDVVEEGPELQALTRNVQRTFSEIIEEIPYLPEELQLAVTNVEDPSRARPSDRRRPADPGRREAGDPRAGERRGPAPPPRRRSSPASSR